MSNLKVNTINDAAGGSNAQLFGVASPPNSMGFRNRIINGAMVIDQRNSGGSVTPSNSQYVVDRWKFGLTQSSKLTAQQSSTAPTGFANSLLITSSSAYSVGAGDVFNVNQPIEGFNFSDLAWGTASAATVTLSFWVRSSLTGTFGGSLVNNGATRSYPFSYTINTANTWEQKAVVIAGDTTGTWVGATNGIGVLVQFGLGVGSTFSAAAGSWAAGNFISATGATSVVGTNGATFYITGVQLEAGTVASPFERRDYGRELIMCQRYCQRFGGSLAFVPAGMMSNSTARMWYNFPVQLRGSATATNNFTGYGSGATQVQVFTNGFIPSSGTFSCVMDFISPYACSWSQNNLTGTGGLVGSFDMGSSAFWTVSAEL